MALCIIMLCFFNCNFKLVLLDVLSLGNREKSFGAVAMNFESEKLTRVTKTADGEDRFELLLDA